MPHGMKYGGKGVLFSLGRHVRGDCPVAIVNCRYVSIRCNLLPLFNVIMMSSQEVEACDEAVESGSILHICCLDRSPIQKSCLLHMNIVFV